MARSYEVIRDFGEDEKTVDLVSVSPYAIVAVWRYRHPVTFSRDRSGSFSRNIIDGIRLRDQVLVILEDIQTLSVTHTKASHVGQLSVSLLPGANYLTEIFPGDWVGAWIVNDAKTAQDLLNRIRNNEPCNRFSDGLKFLGRANAVRTRIMQSPTGIRSSNYTLTASSFTEFDASIYYEPYFASQAVGIASEWLQKTGSKINELMLKGSKNSQAPFITVTEAVPFFVTAFFGAGVPKNQGFSDSTLEQTKGLDDPNAFVVPDEVGNILGVQQGTKPNGAKGWHDICNILYGIQRYQLSSEAADVSRPDAAKAHFCTPDGLNWSDPEPISNRTRRLRCPDEMSGSFLPSPPQFNGQKTVWSILQQYLNPTVNEMYCCLRASPTGDIMPTLVARQLPFSSGILSDQYKPRPIPLNNTDKPTKKESIGSETGDRSWYKALSNPINEPRTLKLTRFVELPRWRIHPSLVRMVDFGRSDAMRFNFVHIYPETGLQNQNRTGYIVRDPPIADDIDILRSGMRPYMATVNCSPQDAESRKAGDWMYIVSDIVMGQHLSLTGTMDSYGIQSPICPGDNIEFDDHIFHIEAVTHVFTMSGVNKTFTTNLALSHGMKHDQLAGNDFSMYSGTSPEDLRTYQAAASRDYSATPEEPISPPDVGRETPLPSKTKAATEPLYSENLGDVIESLKKR